MKNIWKILAFVGAAGAAVAGLLYFLDRKNQDRFFEEELLDDEEDEVVTSSNEERTYVSLDTTEEDAVAAEAAAKKSLKETVKSVAQDMKQKAEDAAKGIGIVKDEEKSEANDFAFKSFDENSNAETEEEKEEQE